MRVFCIDCAPREQQDLDQAALRPVIVDGLARVFIGACVEPIIGCSLHTAAGEITRRRGIHFSFTSRRLIRSANSKVARGHTRPKEELLNKTSTYRCRS